MANAAKYKVNALAKDLNLKSKDIVDVLAEKGIEGKTHMAALEEDELSLLFDHYTSKSTVPDINSYLSTKKKPEQKKETATIDTVPEKEIKTVVNEEPIQAAEKATPAITTENSVKEDTVKTQNREEIVLENATKPLPEQPKQEQPRPFISNTNVPRPLIANTNEPRPINNNPNAPRPLIANTNVQRPFNSNTNVPRPFNNNTNEPRPFNNNTNVQRPYNNNTNEPRPFNNNTNVQRPYNNNTNETRPFNNNTNGQRPYNNTTNEPRPYNNAGNVQRPYNNAPTGQRPYNNAPARPYGNNTYNNAPRPQGGDSTDRPPYQRNADSDRPMKTDTYANVQFTKDGFVNSPTQRPNNAPTGGYNKFGSKPGQKTSNSGFRPNVSKEDDSPSVRPPSVRPIYDKDGRARSKYAQDRKGPATPTTGNVVSRPDGGVRNDSNVRLVDIREREVDLSKYDERLDNLVPDTVSQIDDQRGKKVPTKGVANNRVNRNESAARDVVSGTQPRGRFGKKYIKQKTVVQQDREPVKKFTGPITLPEDIMISDLAAKLKITTGEVIKKLLLMGLGMDVVGANKIVDYDTAYLLADEMGITAEKEIVISIEDKLFAEEDLDAAEDLKPRSPVVVVMGHVDHGKTSLLDAIRHTNVTAGEAGGITQHIGAYRVKIKDREISFLDTPGHEAFTAMRARGAQVTDIAILVVAADDGIMPQTIEAINHAKLAGISVIVAINKMDKPGANPDAIKQNLTKYELIPEEWGGDTICVPVSAIKHEGIEELLEMVLLVADMKDLKANPNRAAKGIVIEAKLDKGRGPVATILVQNGTLHSGDIVIAGTAVGRVRAMTDDKGNLVKEAGPSVPVEITGLSEVPNAGDEFRSVADEKMARELVDQRKSQEKEENFNANAKVSLDVLFDQISEGVKELAIIVKADVQGSAEAVKASLEKLSNDEIKVKVIHSGVGGIKESDVMLADASNAIIVGFNVRPDKGAMDSADRQKVDIRTYRIIYECIEEITAAINGMLAPEFKEVILGRAQVRQTIRVPIGVIAGSYVLDGKITRNAQIRVVRDGVVIFEDKISSLKRFKDDVREVATNYECGIALERFNDIKENDILEAFIMEEIKREL